MVLYWSNILHSSSHYILLPPVTAALLEIPLLCFSQDPSLGKLLRPLPFQRLTVGSIALTSCVTHTVSPPLQLLAQAHVQAVHREEMQPRACMTQRVHHCSHASMLCWLIEQFTLFAHSDAADKQDLPNCPGFRQAGRLPLVWLKQSQPFLLHNL